MKRIVPALVALGLTGALAMMSCGVPNAAVAIQGAVEPKIDTTTLACTFTAADTSALRTDDTVAVPAMKTLNNGVLSRYLGLQVENTMVPPQITTAAGTNSQSTATNDVVVQSAQIDVDDLNGSQLASETVVVNSYVPATGKNVAIMDYLSPAPMTNLLNNHTDDFDVLLKITLQGTTVGGSNVSTGAFTFPVHIRYDSEAQAGTTPDGGLFVPFGAAQCE